jgi:dTDP-4-amino-4,6-dideoxygalactose transaminase
MFKLPFRPAFFGNWIFNKADSAMLCGTGKTTTYWYGGAQALYQGVKSLGLRRGDIVLVPAYSCGSEVAPLLAHGLCVEYYRSLSDLSPDFTHLEALCRKKPRALLATHYFGFPQPLNKLTEFKHKHDLFLIEDNAHGLFSMNRHGAALGCAGDVAIFSFTKSLPIPDGGALLLNHRGLVPPEGGVAPLFFPVAKKIAGRTAYQCANKVATIDLQTGKKIKTRLLDRLSTEPNLDAAVESTWDSADIVDDYLAFNQLRADWRMSSASSYLARRQPRNWIVHRRRRNFSCLLESCKQIRQSLSPLIVRLPKHVCPLLFPIRTADSLSLYHFLRSRGVEAIRFWRFFHSDHPRDQFPFENSLKRNVIALPIHQDIGTQQVRYMTELLHAWSAPRYR